MGFSGGGAYIFVPLLVTEISEDRLALQKRKVNYIL